MKELMKRHWYSLLFRLLPGYTGHILEMVAEADKVANDVMATVAQVHASLDTNDINIEEITTPYYENLLNQNPEPGEEVSEFEAAAKKRVMEIFWACKKKGMVSKDELVNSGFDFVVRKLNYDGSFNIFGRTVFTPVPIFAKTLNEGVEIGYHPGHAEIYFAIMDGYAYVTSYVPKKGGELWKG